MDKENYKCFGAKRFSQILSIRQQEDSRKPRKLFEYQMMCNFKSL